MLLPRYSMRTLLVANLGLAAIFLATSYAVKGQAWAIAIVVACLAAFLLLMTFGGLFALAFVLAKVAPFRRRTVLESPFATDKLPPQILPPRDPV